MLKRVKIVYSYDGSSFYGSQIQTNSKFPTVMGELKKALRSLNINSTAYASGRTDRGVHALSQVCHLDIPSYFSDLEKLRGNLNHFLKPHIYIKNISDAKPEFHARFSAKKRLYRYIVSNSTYHPLYANYMIFIPQLDIDSLNKSLKEFIGTHDFSFFKKQGSDTSDSIRTIYKAYAYRRHRYIIINFLGNSFLRSQIRMICGFLFDMQKGKIGKEELIKQLNLKEQTNTKLAPPQGLYLSKIYYN